MGPLLENPREDRGKSPQKRLTKYAGLAVLVGASDNAIGDRAMSQRKVSTAKELRVFLVHLLCILTLVQGPPLEAAEQKVRERTLWVGEAESADPGESLAEKATETWQDGLIIGETHLPDASVAPVLPWRLDRNGVAAYSISYTKLFGRPP